MKARQLFCILSLILMAMVAGAGKAATTSTTFNVTSEVQSSCVVSATAMGFGVYDPGALTDRQATSTITVTCSLATPYTISLSSGSNPNGNARRMNTGGRMLGYALYRDATRTSTFGTAADALGVSGIGSGVAEVRSVYGTIPASQNVAPGSYSDQVTVTLDY